MALHDALPALRRIAEVRGLQLQRERERAAAARRDMILAEEALARLDEALAGHQASLAASMRSGLAVPAFLNAQASAASVLQRRDDARRALAQARRAWEARRTSLALAQARSDAAAHTIEREKRRLQAHAEKRALTAREELYAQLRGRT